MRNCLYFGILWCSFSEEFRPFVEGENCQRNWDRARVYTTPYLCLVQKITFLMIRFRRQCPSAIWNNSSVFVVKSRAPLAQSWF